MNNLTVINIDTDAQHSIQQDKVHHTYTLITNKCRNTEVLGMCQMLKEK